MVTYKFLTRLRTSSECYSQVFRTINMEAWKFASDCREMKANRKELLIPSLSLLYILHAYKFSVNPV